MNADEVRDRVVGTVIPAVPVPFRGDHIDAEIQARYIAWMTAQPIGGVAVWAHTGRGLHLNPDQRGAVMEAWRTGGGPLLIAGVGVPYDLRLPHDPRSRTDAVIEAVVGMVADARDGGAAAVLVHPPTPLRDLTDVETRVAAVHQAVADTGMPLIAFYLYEAAGGIAYSAPLLDRLVSLPETVGVKLATLDSVVTVQDITGQLADRPEALVITGEDRFLGYSLTLGAGAALIGMAAALTDVFAALIGRHRAGDAGGMLELSAAVDRFAAVAFAEPVDGYVQRMLWALRDDGVLDCDALDRFAPDLPVSDRARVREAVHRLRAAV